MSDKELEKKREEEGDEIGDLLKVIGIVALIGGGYLAYKMVTSPKGQTFIGGGLAATGAKMIRDNWRK